MAAKLLALPEPQQEALALPTSQLSEIAELARDAGIFLLLLDRNGVLAWHDEQAAAPFTRLLVPLLSDGSVLPVQERLPDDGDDSEEATWAVLDGLTVHAVPLVYRRQVIAYLAGAGRTSALADGEELLRACSRLGIDAPWLVSAAGQVPAIAAAQLASMVRMQSALLIQRLRQRDADREIRAIASHLSNAYEELALLDRLSRGMRLGRSSDDFLRQLCLDAMEVLGLRGMGVVVRGEGGIWRPSLFGPIAMPLDDVEHLGDILIERLGRLCKPVVVNDLDAEPSLGWLKAWARQLIAVPFERHERLLGCLFGLQKSEGEFDSVDSKLLTGIAAEASIFLENVRLFEDVHGLMMGLLHSLTSAVDAKDAYTCGHSERVALLSRHLAEKLGLGPRVVERVYMAGLLHDVGKIGVPESVLQKTGKLTREEFDEMKKHPLIGAHILRDIRQIDDVIPGVLHHHERYDGRGYPSGLAGQDIPMFGRLICVADSFDAMTSNRTYRAAMPLEVAMVEIRRCSGTQFDPAMAEVFLDTTVRELRALLDEHQAATGKLLEFRRLLRSK